jgi:hypothetical protein
MSYERPASSNITLSPASNLHHHLLHIIYTFHLRIVCTVYSCLRYYLYLLMLTHVTHVYALHVRLVRYDANPHRHQVTMVRKKTIAAADSTTGSQTVQLYLISSEAGLIRAVDNVTLAARHIAIAHTDSVSTLSPEDLTFFKMGDPIKAIAEGLLVKPHKGREVIPTTRFSLQSVNLDRLLSSRKLLPLLLHTTSSPLSLSSSLLVPSPFLLFSFAFQSLCNRFAIPL